MKKINTDDYICKFVVDGKGRMIGESIALDGDVVIIKMGSKFIGIPVKHLSFDEDDDNILRIKGMFEIDRAEELGKRWTDKYGEG